jgi:hypothetical protein
LQSLWDINNDVKQNNDVEPFGDAANAGLKGQAFFEFCRRTSHVGRKDVPESNASQ